MTTYGWSNTSLSVEPTNRNELSARIVRIVQRGSCCRVLGARFRLKSKLMHSAETRLRNNQSHYTAFLNLKEANLRSQEAFFGDLYRSMVTDLARNGLGVDDVSAEELSPEDAYTFQRALLWLVEQSDRNVAVFFDDVEMGPPNLVASLLGALRAVFSTLVNRRGAQFQAVVCGSLSMNQLALDSASRFESISELVLVGDLDEHERWTLAVDEAERLGVQPTRSGVAAVLTQTGGDTYHVLHLLRYCAKQMALLGRVRLLPARVEEVLSSYIASPEPGWLEEEVLKQVESNPSLLSSALMMLEHGPVSATGLPIAANETPSPLDLCGAFSREGNTYRIKSQLWQAILRGRLTPARVGGLYAIAGQWRSALTYLGQAVLAQDDTVRPELFTATTNAMHASEDLLEAYTFLAQGLRAAYPGVPVHVYRRTDTDLELMYPLALRPKQIPVDALYLPEAEALVGPEHSISLEDEAAWLMVPMRVGPYAKHAIGLVVFGRIHPDDANPYTAKDEISKLVTFLYQAARALQAKSRYANLLQNATTRAEKQRVLNQVLTRVLNLTKREEAVVARLVLAGITCGWGLEFNRSILFLRGEGQSQLRVAHAVGHLEREQAEADWDDFDSQYPDINALMDRVVVDGVPPTPLLDATADLLLDVSAPARDLLSSAYGNGEPVRRLTPTGAPERKLPPALEQRIGAAQSYALVPLMAGEQPLGVVYADDMFNQGKLTEERFELLQTFANQAALILDTFGTLREAMDELGKNRDRQLREYSSRLATGLIHDINSGIASIPDLLAEIESGLKQNFDVSDALGDLRTSVTNTDRISGRLHDFILTGRLMQAEDVLLATILDNAVAHVEKERPPRVALYRTGDDGDEAWLHVDQLWLDLVFENLLRNAFQAIPRRRSGRVTVDVRVAEQAVTIAVSDNGRGIPDANLERVFEPNYSTRKRTGLHGVGLYHSRQIVEEMGGSITVASTLGQGATFTVELPRARMTAGERDETHEADFTG